MSGDRPRNPWLVALAALLGVAGLTIVAVFVVFAVALSQFGSNK